MAAQFAISAAKSNKFCDMEKQSAAQTALEAVAGVLSLALHDHDVACCKYPNIAVCGRRRALPFPGLK